MPIFLWTAWLHSVQDPLMAHRLLFLLLRFLFIGLTTKTGQYGNNQMNTAGEYNQKIWKNGIPVL